MDVAPDASMLWNPTLGDFETMAANAPSVALQKGDYALVRVHEAGRHTLHATPLARTTLEEMRQLVPRELLGYSYYDQFV